MDSRSTSKGCPAIPSNGSRSTPKKRSCEDAAGSPGRPQRRRRLASSSPDGPAGQPRPSRSIRRLRAKERHDAKVRQLVHEQKEMASCMETKADEAEHEHAIRTPPGQSGTTSQRSIFEALTISTTDLTPSTLFTPSPAPRAATRMSTPLSSATKNTFTSPSSFFCSPFNALKTPKQDRRVSGPATSATSRGILLQKSTPSALTRVETERQATDMGANARPPRTPKLLGQRGEGKSRAVVRSRSEREQSPGERKTPLRVVRTPSPPTLRHEPGKRKLKAALFDANDEVDQETASSSGDGANSSFTEDDSLQDIDFVPSGIGDHDAFYSFAHSWSPLVSTEDVDESVLAIRLSPLLGPRRPEMSRLIPPFPTLTKHETEGHARGSKLGASSPRLSPIARSSKASCATPKTPVTGTRLTVHSGSSLADVFKSTSTSPFPALFPNIQAYTSATPGKEERLKLTPQSVMRLKLHESPGAPISQSKHEIQLINDSLRRKKRSRKRKATNEKSDTSHEAPKGFSTAQRKLLQTPVKHAASASLPGSPRRLMLDDAGEGNISQKENHQVQSALSKTPIPEFQPDRNELTPFHGSGTFSAILETPEFLKNRPVPFTPLSATINQLKLTPGSSLPGFQALQLRKTPPSQPDFSAAGSSSQVTPIKTPKAPRKKKAKCTHDKISPREEMAPVTPAPKPRIESDAIKVVQKKAPCNCKKSKCLKLYCECFAAGGYCDASCNCVGCANNPESEGLRQKAVAARLEKNPNAFKPKIESTASSTQRETGLHTGTTPLHSKASSGTKKMHKHGCHCKKSACRKKYCECFQAGVPCGDNCRCIDCKNQPISAISASPQYASASTPSKSHAEHDDTFVSPIGVRQRFKIERELWARDLASPIEASPTRIKERQLRIQSHILQLHGIHITPTGVAVANNDVKGPLHAKAIPSNTTIDSEATSLFQTPQAKGKMRDFPHRIEPVSDHHEIQPMVPFSKTAKLEKTEVITLLQMFGAKQMPIEEKVASRVFQYLDNADIYNASLVNHLWNNVAMGDAVWDHSNFVRAPVVDEDDISRP